MSGNQFIDLTEADQTLLVFAATKGETFDADQSEAWEALYDKIVQRTINDLWGAVLSYKHWFERDHHSMEGFMAIQAVFEGRVKP